MRLSKEQYLAVINSPVLEYRQKLHEMLVERAKTLARISIERKWDSIDNLGGVENLNYIDSEIDAFVESVLADDFQMLMSGE